LESMTRAKKTKTKWITIRDVGLNDRADLAEMDPNDRFQRLASWNVCISVG